MITILEVMTFSPWTVSGIFKGLQDITELSNYLHLIWCELAWEVKLMQYGDWYMEKRT